MRGQNEDFEREFWSGRNLNDLNQAAAAEPGGVRRPHLEGVEPHVGADPPRAQMLTSLHDTNGAPLTGIECHAIETITTKVSTFIHCAAKMPAQRS